MKPDVELALFRVVQESLTNIQRHSGSLQAKIRIDANADNVTLEVSDKGRGISDSERKQTGGLPSGVGVGSPSIHERVNQVGCLLDVESTSSGATDPTLILATD